jgi:hypothetical protein
LGGIVSETDSGFGAALYIHDLDTGTGGAGSTSETSAAKRETQRSTIQ